jgi:serine/threonine protein kinase/formylglycine-generating enzyme required for sulfatase activity
MQTWSITLHGPAGVISSVDTGESQFVIGTETASDVFTVHGDGIAPRHAWVWIGEAGMQVEDLGDGTLVNGYQITERVQVEYPASVQVGEVTLVVEVKAVQPVAVSPTPSSLDITIPQRAVTKSKASMEVTIPQRTPTRTAAGTVNHPKTQISDSPKPDAPLTGGYSLVREIARGGMGQIYFGEDPQLKRNVAVKVSSVSEGGEDPRFSKEAEVLAQLAHPNIVPIYNIGVDAQSRPFYSMKLIKGRTLQAVLNLIRDGDAAAIKDYPRATLLTIFRKVCDAMMFAHSKGILHRDLKPENIMVGEYGEVLVMDWGLAKVLGEREEQGSSVTRVNDTGDYGMTMEGEVMGTPQYMSPEQAMGMVAELDQRSDIYSLGGILYAILTLRPPIDGTTLDEVLTKVKNGSISSMVTKRGGKGAVTVGAPTAMGAEVPEALQAVTLKAMATDRSKRYASVEAFAGDIERYQNGFATQAEDAGAMKRVVLFIKRNKGVSAALAVFLLAATGFVVKLAASERKASAALARLRESAPTFALRAADAVQSGNLEEALEAASNAVDLQPDVAEYHRILGNVLQVMIRWPEAVKEYRLAKEDDQAQKNLRLTEELIQQTEKDATDTKSKGRLFEELNAQGRQYEAMVLSSTLGDFWKDRKKDLSVIPELVRRLEAKMLPVPGTKILLSKTEFTVGEWKLYLKAEGLPDWKQPSKDFEQHDEHPVVNVSWNDAKKFCEWFSKATGKEWRLPTSAEWELAVGSSIFPWGNNYPPQWDDGNYTILDDGRADPKKVGSDGILGTAPVASFKPNALGFYDLGGNVWEWMSDGVDDRSVKKLMHIVRGGGWYDDAGKNTEKIHQVANRNYCRTDNFKDAGNGFRIARGSGS